MPEDSLAEQHDQIIISWIIMAISPSILPHVATLTTLVEAWECLKQLYSSNSETHLLHLQNELQNVKKINLSMADYLKKICVLKEKLASADGW